MGTKLADGRNEALFFNAPVTGAVLTSDVYQRSGRVRRVLPPGRHRASTRPADITGQVYNDLNGSGTNDAGRSRPEQLGSRRLRLERQLRRLADHRRQRQLQHPGLAPGTYTVERGPAERLDADPRLLPDTFTVTVTAGGQVLSGNDFGNFQNITISGEKFNDLTGNGVAAAGRSGPAGLDHRPARLPPAPSSPPR